MLRKKSSADGKSGVFVFPFSSIVFGIKQFNTRHRLNRDGCITVISSYYQTQG